MMTSMQLAPAHNTSLHSSETEIATRVDSDALKIEVSLPGDTRRIFEALTVPEYMELWMSMPGEHSVCYSTASRSADGFILDHLCDSRPPIRIAGTYLMCLRRKLIFRWSVSGSWISPLSYADIRLSGDFGKSVLRLRHSGFASQDEYFWHTQFWNCSLARLSRLLAGVSASKPEAGL